ncbi:MAG: homoserine dehydrogenase, partial [Planctomycetota bacterium]
GGLYGILNGTCNYILTEMARRGKTYAEALAEAKDRGYAEADETLDVSGADAAQKLAVLASLAFGARVVEADVPCRGIDTLDRSDVGYAEELGYEVKLIAAAERWPGETDLALGTEPCLIARDAPLAQVHGSFNALSVVGHAVGHTMFYGRGAGQGPTASAVVADLLNVAAGAYPAAFAGLRLTPDLHGPPPLVAPGDLESRWYLRLDALDVPGIVAKVTAELARRDISLASLLQHDAVGDTVPLVMTTHDAKRGDLDDACRTIADLPAVHGTPVVYRILDLPA